MLFDLGLKSVALVVDLELSKQNYGFWLRSGIST